MTPPSDESGAGVGDASRGRYDALVAVAGEVLVGLDFDGTLSPIVEDPSRAVIHPDGPRVLAALATRVRAVVVVTGRPARQVVELGDLDRLADTLPDGARPVSYTHLTLPTICSV